MQKTGDSPGAVLGSVGTCPSLCNDRLDGADSAENCGSSAVAAWGRPFLDKVVDTPAGVQRQARGPDCEKSKEIPQFFRRCSFFSRCIFCPGSSGQVFQPSITKSSW